jgi:hypothetical protein
MNHVRQPAERQKQITRATIRGMELAIWRIFVHQKAFRPSDNVALILP